MCVCARALACVRVKCVLFVCVRTVCWWYSVLHLQFCASPSDTFGGGCCQ